MKNIGKGLLKSKDVIEHGVETLNVSRPNKKLEQEVSEVCIFCNFKSNCYTNGCGKSNMVCTRFAEITIKVFRYFNSV